MQVASAPPLHAPGPSLLMHQLVATIPLGAFLTSGPEARKDVRRSKLQTLRCTPKYNDRKHGPILVTVSIHTGKLFPIIYAYYDTFAFHDYHCSILSKTHRVFCSVTSHGWSPDSLGPGAAQHPVVLTRPGQAAASVAERDAALDMVAAKAS